MISKYKTIFFGTPDFAVPVLKTIITLPYLKLQAVVTQPDKPAGRKQILTSSPVKLVALENNISIHQPEKIKGTEFEQEFKKLDSDVVIIVAYGKIIPQNLLEIPKYGFLNIHASLLPKYRGASPIQNAILAGEKETGVTLMKIDQGLDTGPIISQKKLEIRPDDNFKTLHDKLSLRGADLIKETLLDYLEGRLSPTPQDNTKATTTETIKKEDGRIDWSKPAVKIERHIRAFNPWPGAFCFYNQKRLKIIEASLAKDQSKLNPGETKEINGLIIVGCEKNNLELKKVQLEGKIPQTVPEFIMGYPGFKHIILK